MTRAFIRAVLAFSVACSIAILAAPSSADELSTLEGSAVQAGDSQIDLYRVFAVKSNYHTWVCAFFTNTSAKTAVTVRLRFYYLGMTGAAMNQEVGSDTNIAHGTFSTGAKIEAYPVPGRLASYRKNCHAVDASIEDGGLHFGKPDRRASLWAQVESVEYADGSAWSAQASPGASAPP